MKKTNIAVLLSGGGTTFQYILDRIHEGGLNAEIQCVISSNPAAYGLVRAQKHGIETHVVHRAEFTKIHGDEAHDKFNAALIDILSKYDIDLIVLAGFMSLLSTELVFRYHNRIMNTHPALIPSFCGKNYYGHHVHEAVIEFGAKVSGCTIHFVDEKYDHGPIVLQEAVPVFDNDTPDSLAARVQAIEKPLYCKAVKLFSEKRIEVRGRRVFVLPENPPEHNSI